MQTLPYATLTWVNEQSLIAAGNDCQPMLFAISEENQWSLIGSLDDAVNAPTASSPVSGMRSGLPRGGGASAIGRLNNEAFNRFKSADARGGVSSPSTLQAQLTGASSPTTASGGGGSGLGITEMMTVHQNTITSVRPYEYAQDGSVLKVSTTGVDGKLVIWTVDFSAAAANGAGAAGSLASRLAGVSLRR